MTPIQKSKEIFLDTNSGKAPVALGKSLIDGPVKLFRSHTIPGGFVGDGYRSEQVVYLASPVQVDRFSMRKDFDGFSVVMGSDGSLSVLDQTMRNVGWEKLRRQGRVEYAYEVDLRAPLRTAGFVAAVLREAKTRPDVAAFAARFPDVFRRPAEP
jgi:hypothetical protein